MRSSSLQSIVERARPLLGTYVAIRVSGVPESCAHRVIDAAFDDIALVYHRMSFHEAESDVSRLNENALRHAVQVHPRTYEVLRWAQQIAEASHGWFDVTVARHLVAWGVLPRPRSAYDPDPRASWRDIELRRDGAVRFRRPTWIDLGGIAKGYAVDRAVELLRASGVPRGCVNAGGDLRVFGPARERVRLRTPSRVRGVVPVVDVRNASVASSGRDLERQRARGRHVDAARERPAPSQLFACVVADRCVVADALTKIVLSRGRSSERVLRHYQATAYVATARQGWRTLGA